MQTKILARLPLAVVLAVGLAAAPLSADDETGAAQMQPSTRMADFLGAPLARPGPVTPLRVYRNASLTSAGHGLRNMSETSFLLVNVQPPVRNVFLYWTVVTESDPPAEAATMTVTRLDDDLDDEAQVEVTGSLIGEGFDCWGFLTSQFDSRINVYRAMVPRTLVSRNGWYAVKPPAGFPGDTAHFDPFTPGTSV